MAVSTINRFSTLPGGAVTHMEMTLEAVGHLRRLDIAAVALQPIAGGDTGSLVTTMSFENNAAWATSMQRLLADDGWQDFWQKAVTSASAEQSESSIFADVDPNYVLDPNRPLGVIAATQWRALPGRMGDFAESVMTATGHITRLGGRVRVMQSLMGQHPMTTMVAIGHADLDAYAEFSDAVAADEEFQAYWMETAANPSADILRSGVYMNIS